MSTLDTALLSLVVTVAQVALEAAKQRALVETVAVFWQLKCHLSPAQRRSPVFLLSMGRIARCSPKGLLMQGINPDREEHAAVCELTCFTVYSSNKSLAGCRLDIASPMRRKSSMLMCCSCRALFVLKTNW